MSWSTRRQSRLILLVVGFFVLLAIAPIYFFLHRAPSCFDGEQNGTEAGVDCGGVCQYLCPYQTTEPIVVWARSFKASRGIYNAVALVENHNTGAGTDRISYSFKLYDDRNILIAERKGVTNLVPRISSAIFEASILTGERIPTATFFQFTSEPLWEYMEREEQVFEIQNQVLSGEDRTPRLDARIANTSIHKIDNIEVVALLYDASSNVLAASATVVDVIPKDSFADVVFTWNEPFKRQVTKIDIVPRIKP